MHVCFRVIKTKAPKPKTVNGLEIEYGYYLVVCEECYKAYKKIKKAINPTILHQILVKGE